jgi:hypothetical protein
MANPFGNYGPKDGLHILKDKWTQKSYLKEHAQCL